MKIMLNSFHLTDVIKVSISFLTANFLLFSFENKPIEFD